MSAAECNNTEINRVQNAVELVLGINQFRNPIFV